MLTCASLDGEVQQIIYPQIIMNLWMYISDILEDGRIRFWLRICHD